MTTIFPKKKGIAEKKYLLQFLKPILTSLKKSQMRMDFSSDLCTLCLREYRANLLTRGCKLS